MRFCLSLHKSIKVSLTCPYLPSREDNFSLLSFPVMHILKLGRQEVCTVLFLSGVVRKPDPEKDTEKSY